MNMPSGWQTGTYESAQGLRILALGGLLLELLSVCVGFQNHCLSNCLSIRIQVPFKKTVQVMKSNQIFSNFF